MIKSQSTYFYIETMGKSALLKRPVSKMAAQRLPNALGPLMSALFLALLILFCLSKTKTIYVLHSAFTKLVRSHQGE